MELTIIGADTELDEKIVVVHQEIEFDDGKVKRIVFETITRERGE